MKWYSAYEHPEMFFIIEYESNVGYYLYGYYEDFSFFEKDIKSPAGCPNHQYDDLQGTLEMAKLAAFDDFGVPVDSWVEVAPPQ